MIRLGVVPQAKWDAYQRGETNLPSLHSPFFAPDPDKSIDTGVKALTAMALDLLSKRVQ
jgi:hippurate hydrolase